MLTVLPLQQFDAHRFERLRTSPSAPDPLGYRNREQYQFVSVTRENTSFGFGRHACPGRFFAGCEIKLVLALLLLRYDIRLRDGEAARPAPNMFMMTKSPSMTAEIMFRRRTD